MTDRKIKIGPRGSKVAVAAKAESGKAPIKNQAKIDQTRDFDESMEQLERSQNTLLPDHMTTAIASISLPNQVDEEVRELLQKPLTKDDNIKAWQILEQLRADMLGQRQSVTASDMSILVALGVTLALEDEDLYERTRKLLDVSFSLSYESARYRRNQSVQRILELGLEGALLLNKQKACQTIVSFGKNRNYLIKVERGALKQHMEQLLRDSNGLDHDAIAIYKTLINNKVLVKHGSLVKEPQPDVVPTLSDKSTISPTATKVTRNKDNQTIDSLQDEIDRELGSARSKRSGRSALSVSTPRVKIVEQNKHPLTGRDEHTVSDISYLNVSDLLDIYHEVEGNQTRMAQFLVIMCDVVDNARVAKWLASKNLFHILHQVVDEHHINGAFEFRDESIIAMIKEVFENCSYRHIIQLMEKYDFTFQLLSKHFMDALFDSFLQEPNYAEFKLTILYELLPRLSQPQTQKVINTFQQLIEQIKEEKVNLWTANTMVGLITVLMLEILARIASRFPQLDFEMNNARDLLLELFGQLAAGSTPVEMEQYFNLRTYKGWMGSQIVLKSKAYELMQEPAADQQIIKYWVGKSDLSIFFMSQSATYNLLFTAPLDQHQDYEKGMRQLMLTFDRKQTKQLAPHGMSYIGYYQPFNLRFILETIIVFAILFYGQWIILGVYDRVQGEAFPIMQQMQAGVMLTMQQQALLMEIADYVYVNMARSLYFMGVSLVIPVTFLQKWLYAGKTNMSIFLTPVLITDACLFISYIVCMNKFFTLRDQENMGFGMMAPPSKELMFMQSLLDDINEEVFNQPILISFVCGFTWLRILAAVAITEMFGPRVMTMLRMINDIFQFFVIYLLQLYAFSLVGSMAFFRVTEFNGIYECTLYLFNATFGSYSFAIFDVYDDQPTMKYIGHFFLAVFIYMNLVLLLNMVIAMMADTYGFMNDIKKGVYNYQILALIPQFKMNKSYGGLIAFPPVLNLLAIPLLPIYAIVGNKRTLEDLTSKVMFFNYALFLLIASLIYVALNLVMLPFAYLKTVVAKFKLSKNGSISVADAFAYLLYGLPLLMALQIADLVDFAKWSSNMKDPDHVKKEVISNHHFEIFYEILDKIHTQGKKVRVASFIGQLRTALDVGENIFKAAFANQPIKRVQIQTGRRDYNDSQDLVKTLQEVVDQKEQVLESDRGLLYNHANEIQDKAIEILKAYSLMKTVLWQSAIHMKPDGTEIDKEDQLLNVEDLYTKCLEIRMLLDMRRAGIVTDISEKKILERFSYIKTARIMDIMQENVWSGGNDEAKE